MDKVLDAYPGDNVRAVGTTSRPWMRWPASISNSSPHSRRVAATASVSPSGPPTTSSLRPPARSCRTTRGRRRRAPCGCRSRASAGRRCSERRQGEGGELLGQPHQREVAVHRLRLEDPLVGIQLAPGGLEHECRPLRVGRRARHDRQRRREPLRVRAMGRIARRLAERPHLRVARHTDDEAGAGRRRLRRSRSAGPSPRR